jgi:hypothetical protein
VAWRTIRVGELLTGVVGGRNSHQRAASAVPAAVERSPIHWIGFWIMSDRQRNAVKSGILLIIGAGLSLLAWFTQPVFLLS